MASIQPRLQAKPPYSIEVPGQTPQKGETTIRRIPAAVPDLVAKPDPNISTLYELVRVSVEKYGYVHHNKMVFPLSYRGKRASRAPLPFAPALLLEVLFNADS